MLDLFQTSHLKPHNRKPELKVMWHRWAETLAGIIPYPCYERENITRASKTQNQCDEKFSTQDALTGLLLGPFSPISWPISESVLFCCHEDGLVSPWVSTDLYPLRQKKSCHEVLSTCSDVPAEQLSFEWAWHHLETQCFWIYKKPTPCYIAHSLCHQKRLEKTKSVIHKIIYIIYNCRHRRRSGPSNLFLLSHLNRLWGWGGDMCISKIWQAWKHFLSLSREL